MTRLVFEAMILDLPDTPGHPNKLPFTGILTRIGTPSDGAPSGSDGRRVILSQAAARAALPTLLGMAVDLVPDLDGHDPTNKIGLITRADISGSALEIAGILYAADFPAIVKDLRARQSVLGFSFEASLVAVADETADPLVIQSCVFTGAAILRKDRAAYRTTSFDAARAAKERPMPIIPDISTQLSKSQAHPADMSAGRMDCLRHVMPHVQALRKAAAHLSEKGIGLDPAKGHVAVLQAMADDLANQAQKGTIPHRFKPGSALNDTRDDPCIDPGDGDPDGMDDGDPQNLSAGQARGHTNAIRRRSSPMPQAGDLSDQHMAAQNLQKAAERLTSGNTAGGPLRRTMAGGGHAAPSLLASINGPARPLAEWNQILDGLPTDERIQIKVLLRQRNLIV